MKRATERAECIFTNRSRSEGSNDVDSEIRNYDYRISTVPDTKISIRDNYEARRIGLDCNEKVSDSMIYTFRKPSDSKIGM